MSVVPSPAERAVAADARPPALARRMEAALDAYYASGRADAHRSSPEAYLGAAEALLTQLLSADCTSRECALDLLAADALVTYAFELAGDDPLRIEARAELATMRLAALANTSPPDR